MVFSPISGFAISPPVFALLVRDLRRGGRESGFGWPLLFALIGGIGVFDGFHSIRNPTSSGIFELENPSPYPLPFRKKERGSMRDLAG